MTAKPTIRLMLLGAMLMTGCQIKIDPSILPVVPSPRPIGEPTPGISDPPVVIKSSPRPAVTPTPGPEACSAASPAATPITGTSRQGAYNGQRLPNGWDNFGDEMAVTAAIRKLSAGGGPTWSCFMKFYPGAYEVFKRFGTTAPPSFPPFTCDNSPNAGVCATPPPPSIRPWFPPPPPCRPYVTNQVGISGSVYDEQGVPFADGVEVRVRNKDHSFSVDAQVTDGRYWVYGAPAGVKLEITVVHTASGEARRRFITPQAFFQECGPQTQGFSVVNFGGPKSGEDPLGHRYPLPEQKSTYKRGAGVVAGQVADLGGQPLDGATVTISSLQADVAFKATATTAGGNWVINDVPTGVPMEIRAEFPGYHARARADVFFGGEGGRKGNVVNFGGRPTIEDPQGPQYGLAPRPPEDQLKAVPVKGRIQDIDGKAVGGGKIRVISLEPDMPYEATAPIAADGTYYLENVPAGVEVEILIEVPGYEPLVRYERLRTGGGAYLNFGVVADEDPEGTYFGLIKIIVQ